jgi:2-polyprenyl-6-methoxyphenol hydroxylase-like FAD-dependent oxidoreductase
MAGLAAARVLADHFDQVTVLDRDDLPDTAETRKGAPQGRHAHALLGGGAQAIEQLFPGMMEQLAENGAELIDFNDGRWHQAGGYRTTSLIERKVVSASRPFIEANLRERVWAWPGVQLETGVTITNLVHDGERVRGVGIIDEEGAPRTLQADFVVDSTGRGSNAHRWLQDIGFEPPEVIEVPCGVRYATTTLRRSASDMDASFAISIESPPDGKRAGFLLPVEGDRWIVTIASSFGAAAPTDDESFRRIAATLPSPEISQVLERAEQLTPVATHRLPSSKRRRYENSKRVPAGFVALGDSISSFNPIYGQGMSSAVMQAVALGECLSDHANDGRLPHIFYKRAAKIVATPWKIAVGNDLAYPENTAPKPAGTDLVNRYMKRVLLATHVSPEVNTEMILVQNLLAPPSTLFRPSMVRMVLRAARIAEKRMDAQLSPAPGGHQVAA